MKKVILNIFIASLFVGFYACEPIENRDELKSITSVDAIELTATQENPGSNEIQLLMNTPGVTGYWRHALGKEFTNEATVLYPVVGTFDFTFVGSVGDEFFEKTISVAVTDLDVEVAPEWGYLLGDDAIGGKTWVFATDRPDSDPFAGSGKDLHFFMVADYDWTEFWWDAGNPDVDGSVVPDVAAEMTFSLDGGVNYVYEHEGEIVNGSFELDLPNESLKIIDADLVGAYGTYLGDTQDGKYVIKKITENELILFQIHGEGFCWIFKPKGHEYQ